jgi:hypothetical protein
LLASGLRERVNIIVMGVGREHRELIQKGEAFQPSTCITRDKRRSDDRTAGAAFDRYKATYAERSRWINLTCSLISRGLQRAAPEAIMRHYR